MRVVRSAGLACLIFALMLVTIGGGRVLAQDVALANRAPRFLASFGAAGGMPVEVDASSHALLRRVVSLNFEQATVGQLLDAIERQVGVRFFYARDLVSPDRPITLRAERITVATALMGILVDAGVDVLLSRGNRIALVAKRHGAQAGSVVGQAADGKTGQDISAVDVSLEGTRWRTTTDANGRYRLTDVPPGSYTALARRIGYAPERRPVTVTAGHEVSLDFALQPSATKLGDVVVTAQKREERLQDVPLSVAVVTPEEISQRGLVSAEDYLRGIPGVSQANDHFGETIVIRGIETQVGTQNYYTGGTTATYFGETPTTASAALSGSTNVDLKLMDVERVEVLRGPQGTAFGTASLGGAVRTIPVAPKLDRAEGKVAGGYSVTSGSGGNNYSVQAIGNFPLVKDKLALRAVVYRHDESGYYRNVAGSNPDSLTQVSFGYGAQAFATDYEQVGATRATGGRVAALLQASEDLRFTVSYLKQKSELDGWGLSTSGTYEQSLLRIAPQQADRSEDLGFTDRNFDLANAVMEYDFGWASLLATYSYMRNKSEYVASLFYRPLPLSYRSRSEHHGHIGEVRLTTHFDGAFNVLGGLYAEDLDDEGLWDPYWYGSPERNVYAPGETGFLGEFINNRNLKQKAAFAEVSWTFLPGTTLIGGARVYNYDRTELTENRDFFGATTSPVTVGANAPGTSFRANLSHKITDNAMVYAGWAQGFRPGRGQTGLITNACDRDGNGFVDGTNVTVASTTVVNSDNVDNYEVGGKFTLLERRLMIAADVYRMDWSDIPVTVNVRTLGFVDDPTGPRCFGAYTTNAGAARSEGAEFQTNFYATESFRVDIGGAYIRARLTTDVPTLNAPAGTRLPGSPEFNANLGLQYQFKIGNKAAFVRADPIYVGSFKNGVSQLARTSSGGYVRVDASARLATANTSIDLFIRNLTNADEFTNGGADPKNLYGFRLRPRTIGLQVTRGL